MSARIAIVTTVELPVPDADEEMLLPYLPEAELAAWDDPAVDWASYEVAILRSTWNYHAHLPEFLAWAEETSRVARLHNPVEIIRWNTDKKYLLELAEKGVPIVPTTFVDPGQIAPALDLRGRVVVKPSVGAGSAGAKLFRDDAAAAAAHLAGLHAAGKTAMIQPYIDGVDTHGETAMMYVGGRFSHAANKAAILSRDMSWSTGIYADEKVGPAEATAEQRRLADNVLADMPALAYARVDVVPGPDGPLLLELEVTEPSLFLGLDPDAPERAAAAFRALLD